MIEVGKWYRTINYDISFKIEKLKKIEKSIILKRDYDISIIEYVKDNKFYKMECSKRIGSFREGECFLYSHFLKDLQFYIHHYIETEIRELNNEEMKNVEFLKVKEKFGL